MMLSPHFALDEFVLSQTAVRLGIDNTPPPDVLERLKHLAAQLELVRAALGVPLLISSGYRSPQLNAAVGGARKSDHVSGVAVDFTAPGLGPPIDVCRAVAQVEGLAIRQLIHEFGRWVHLSVAMPGEAAKRELLTIKTAGRYMPGLIA